MEQTTPTEDPKSLYDVMQQAKQPAKEEEITVISEPLTCAVLLNALLKSPVHLIATMHTKQSLPWKPLVALSSLSLVLFGIVVGAFSGAEQLWLAPLKIVLGLGFGSLICVPSLYIFCCLSGAEVRVKTVISLMLCAVSLLSLILVGFAPIVWLFSASSSSIGFFGFLCTLLWLVSLVFGFRLIGNASRYLGMRSAIHLKVWMLVFALVTLQLPTTLRPIIGRSTKVLNLEEKKFFLQHWFSVCEQGVER